MILCAGLGTRLLPITEKCPKPLVPVLNIPNLLHNLFILRRAGIHEVILNLHHLGEQIEAVLGNGSAFGMKIEYSHEPILLGTGGGVKKAESFFKNETFVLMNCDFVTNIDITPVINHHLESQALATMVLLDDEMRERAYSPVGVNPKGELCSLPKLQTSPPVRTGIFTGIHVLHPSTLSVLKPEPSGINEILYPHFMKHSPHKVFGSFAENSYWYDTGNLPFFWATSMALLDELTAHPKGLLAQCLSEFGNLVQVASGVWAKPDFVPPKHVSIRGPVIIGGDCHFEEGATIGPKSVIGDGVHIESNASVIRSILLGRSRVARNESLERVVRYGDKVLPLTE